MPRKASEGAAKTNKNLFKGHLQISHLHELAQS